MSVFLADCFVDMCLTGAAGEQTEVVQHWQNGSGEEDPEQEGAERNKEEGKQPRRCSPWAYPQGVLLSFAY